ncbi:MAG: ATP-binding protein [Planctomycetota bacterium]
MDTPESLARLREENERLRAELAASQRLATIGTVASSVTHEFNNVLTTVINYAKMGLRHRDDETRTKAFERVLAAGQRAAKVTTGLLSYARGKDGRREATDLGRLTRDVLVLLEKDLKRHRISLAAEAADGVVATVDAVQLQQVLMNLVLNARQATGTGGSLTVRVSADEVTGEAAISVRDDGPGIPVDVLPRIFEPFVSTKTADDAGQGGTGLGLAYCREAVEAHGGKIRVRTEVGRGTEFTVVLPATAEPIGSAA